MDPKISHDNKRDSGYMSLGGNEAMDVDEDLSSPRVSYDRTLIVSAGISLGSPRRQRRGRRLNTTGARVTHTVRSSDGPPTAAISTTVVGNSSGASVRPSYSVNPGNNGDPQVLGVITVGDVEKEEFGGGQVEQNHEAVSGGKEPGQNKNKNDDQKWASPRHPNGVFQNPLPPDPPKPTVFQIFVKNLDGKTFTFTVRASDTVDSLHEQVRQRIGIPSDQCWINFEGRKLQLGKTLGEHGVYEHSTMFLQTRLRGG